MLELKAEALEIYQQYLHDLSLKRKDLLGKRILDIGSGNGSFTQVIKAKKIRSSIINLDPEIDTVIPYRADFVRAIAQKLPFKDNTFDLVLAHASIPFVFRRLDRTWNKQDITQSFDEALRVMRIGGEARISGMTDIEWEKYMYSRMDTPLVKRGIELDMELHYEIENQLKKMEEKGRGQIVLIHPTLILRKI